MALQIDVDPKWLQPDNVMYMNDTDNTTCSSFTSSTGRPAPTTFMISAADSSSSTINVTIIVKNVLACKGPPLYVSPITSVASEKWTGKRTSCPVTSNQAVGEVRTCSYTCQCPSGGCEQIQVTHRPRTPTQLSWSICGIMMTGMLLI